MTTAIETAALSAFVKLLFEKIGNIAFSKLSKFPRKKKVIAKINKWRKTLTHIHAVLEDAEEKQLTNQSVKMWLDSLRDLAYDVEDILDEFATEILQRQLKDESQASSSNLRKLSHTVGTTINPVAVMFNSKMMSKMKQITTRFQEIVDQQKDLDLINRNVGGTSFSKVCVRPPSTCLHHEPRVYGRDEDKRKIIDLISSIEASDVKVGVIPIVGMGGVGKTTLARLVYNDELSQQNFHLKAWVCVSDEFDILIITKSILESITLQSCDLKELNQVQLQLREQLAAKKFLIVLDDVWNKNYNQWDTLRSSLMCGAPGSIVIVTTRDEDIARMMKTIQYHNLNCISDEDCWKLFLDHAFDSGSVADPKVEVIREKVINKCGGLPLAARTLGGLLRSKPQEHWEDVMNSEIWNSQGDGNNILSLLRLSYYHLPSHLKRCFAYCAILPKDYVFEKKQLVLLWMAEGLIEQRDDQHMEDVGEEYFQDLLSRSLFQFSSTGGFVMHDLVNDLAQVVAGDTYFRLEEKSSKKEKARYSSYIPCRFDRRERFEPFETMKHMRTFLPLSLAGDMDICLANCIPSYLFSKLRFLRVLSFNHYKITKLPDSIGDLKHLRYLDLSYTCIVTLPERTTSLCNLQTMLLKGCRDLEKLPSEMQNLINLRHLDIRGTYVKVMPQGMEKLRSLRTLSDFVVGEGNEVGITALENLKFLRGALRISRLDNVANASNVRGTILLDKGRIDDLVMAWGRSYLASRSFSFPNGDSVVLEKMKPHESLEKLTIIGYGGGFQFPSWVGDPLFRNLVCLKLENCNCTTLPQLGLLSSLKDLVIKGFPSVRAVDREFCWGSMSSSNPFPALETLRFEDMEEWKEWNICGCKFRLLRELSIVNCPEVFGELPSDLPSLQTLEIRECYGLVVSFQNLPSISHFQIQGCRKVELRGGFSAANLLMVSKVESFLFGSEELEQGLRKLKALTVGNHSNYESFTVGNNYFYPLSCPHWVLFEDIAKRDELLHENLADSQIKNLEFCCCEGLEKLPPWIHSFKSLRKLYIENCPRLISLPDAVIYKSLCLEELKIFECGSLISIGRHQLPTTLKRLEIQGCDGLQRLLDARETCSSSRFTDKEGISCDAYSSNLQHLEIFSCLSLTFLGDLPVFDNNTSLESIEINSAPRLKSLPENLHMLTNLRRIFIYHCEGLEALPDGMHNLTSLQELTIMNCPNVVSFPQGGLPTTHLKKIILESCGKLKALPDNMHNLTSLQELIIMNCPNVVSFPQGGLPTTHLKKIILESCGKLEALPDNMHNLTSLEVLAMQYCPGIMSFPEEGSPLWRSSQSQVDVPVWCPFHKMR
ncbi:putative disease resistance protein RGA4 isoform X2 [Hevea brasiliensis]|uniref:putative disease resistance protein RGA4 isoform X2 n=1 Tax=Hevea brasiliensis TaxID=3981 RepID=UPI0025F524A2|nr:putative disease resistance protein RGA4 isoform X2 [Hevea brasiliensis]